MLVLQLMEKPFAAKKHVENIKTFGSTIMPTTLEYERNRLAMIKGRKAEEAGHLADIRNIASELLYGWNANDKQRRKGEDGGSGSEYEPNEDEEVDDADEVSGEEEEHEATLHMSKGKNLFESGKASFYKITRKKAYSKDISNLFIPLIWEIVYNAWLTLRLFIYDLPFPSGYLYADPERKQAGNVN